MAGAALLLPLILSALVTSTHPEAKPGTASSSLSCTECLGAVGRTCQGPSVSCRSGLDACVATIESYVQDGTETTFYRQYCGEKNMCSFTGSLTTSAGTKKVASSCCFTSNCSPATPKLPEMKTDKTGLLCETCNTDKGVHCDSSMARMECTGEEKQCVSMNNVTTKGEISSGSSIRGCGTPELCTVGERGIQFGGATSTITVTCQTPLPSAAAIHVGAPILLLLAFFIMKVIS